MIENIIESLTINTISTILDLVPAQNFIAASSVQNRIIREIVVPDAPPPNAVAQYKVTEAIVKINSEIEKCQKTYNMTTDQEVKFKLLEHIQCLKQTLHTKSGKLQSLKKKAEYQQRYREIKDKELQENQQVMKYDSPRRPSLLFKHPDLLKQIHNSIEFGAADCKRRKETIKVRTINHLRDELEKNYNEHISYTTVCNYLLPRHQNSIVARKHHHLTNVQVTSISRNEMKEHPNGHYCLASIKAARQFAALFPIFSVIVFQDDKAKIPLGIPAVGKTFKAIQSANEPTTLPDHDFPVGSKQKLIPSIYLLIDPNDTNDTLRSGQLSIYIHSQYEIGTSAMTYMSDLQSLVNNSHFDNRLKVDDKIRPIWVLIVDGSPDENLRHLKNIYQYCNMFRSFDLDYLTVRTYAPSQSAYNPVERSMAPLSNRLAGIVLPVDHYGSHLNSQDPIFGKPVITEYVDIENIPFPNVEFPELENNIDNYNVSDLLATNNGFLLPLVMGKDSHYVNSIHLLEYYDKGKIP
ncbi:214_t:CDS:2, partial [Cetraspora pellucida]